MEFLFIKKLELNSLLIQWEQWWSHLLLTQKISPLFMAILYPLTIEILSKSSNLGGLRLDHFLIAGTAMLLWYLGPRFRNIFYFFLPLFLVGVVYDSMRYYADIIRGPIHINEPHDFDLFFFGINHQGVQITPNEWFQLHTSPILDVITGFFYLAFIPIYVLISAYFCFFIAPLHKPQERFHPMWAFFWVNVLGYSTYYWYAAAPPWYLAQYGNGPIQTNIAASAAGAIRFDLFFGTHFFSGMYGRAADIFGAIPSLHVAYPLQAVFYAFRYGKLKAFSLFFYFIMCFSAVYLNHHYLLDIIWGSTYAIFICVIFEPIKLRLFN